MPHVELPQVELKIALIGDSNTGKTALVRRFSEGYFREGHRSATLAASFASKRIQVQGMACKVQVWDTAGQAQFRPLAKAYYQNSSAVILCYDISSQSSYEVLKFWLKELHRNGMADRLVMCICETKSDQTPRVIPKATVEELADSIGAIYMETSAKHNTNVVQLFKTVAERVLAGKENLPHSVEITKRIQIGNADGSKSMATDIREPPRVNRNLFSPPKLEGPRTKDQQSQHQQQQSNPQQRQRQQQQSQEQYPASTNMQSQIDKTMTPPRKQRRNKRTKAEEVVYEDDIPEPGMCGILPEKVSKSICPMM